MNESALPIVDFEVVRANTLGDDGFERRLLQAFLDDNEERMKVAKAALDADEGEALEMEAHSLKGAAATLGAQPLADAARALESAAAKRALADARRRFAEVEHEMERVREVLRERLAQPS